ncbi:MAG: hypothetical protein MJK04_37230, partial [Psychrosphaera sp.]|nr:hypothetical protein [Psychrosphaera sp.]
QLSFKEKRSHHGVTEARRKKEEKQKMKKLKGNNRVWLYRLSLFFAFVLLFLSSVAPCLRGEGF